MKDDMINRIVIEQENLIAYCCDLQTYEICYVTKPAMNVCGCKRKSDMIGKKCYEVIQGFDQPCSFCINQKLKKGQIYQWEHYNQKYKTWLSIQDTLIEIDHKLLRLEIAQDITMQRNKLKEISSRLSIEETLIECIQTLSYEKDVATAMSRFLEIIGKYYAAQRAYIFEFDFAHQVIHNTFEWCAPGIDKQIDNLQSVPMKYVACWIKKFEQEGEFFINSLTDDFDRNSPEYEILKNQGIQSLSASPLIKDDEIIGFIGVDNPSENINNMTLLHNINSFVLDEMERRRLIEELEHTSYTDLLTGLGNRNFYIKVLNELSEHAPESLGVVFIDINGMKRLNDDYSHEYGDTIIREIASILKENVKEYCFRIGGDEFIILYVNITQANFKHTVDKLRNEFAAHQECDVSIGSTWKKGSVCVKNEVLKADECMYAEKQKYYHSVLHNGRKIRTGIASEILQQIAENRFEVFYQPFFDLKTKAIVGVEALIRKHGKDNQLQQPDTFVPFYEKEGIISHLDLFVFESVCKTLREWNNAGISINASINLSRVTMISTDIVHRMRAYCARYQISPQDITIEITESASKLSHEKLAGYIKQFTEEGFSIALDDFGSQYSNLSILTAIDFHKIKLDKSLVDQLAQNPKSRIIMKHILDICNALPGTHSLAEGIETKEQLDFLLQQHCDYGQGFYFSGPMSSNDMYDALKKATMKEDLL